MTARRGGRNRRTAAVLAIVAIGMVGMSFAAVPLYRLFCQVTGFGGTTQVADHGSGEIFDRVITVRFNADIASDLPWRFKPAQTEIAVRVGENAQAFYHARNLSTESVTGSAVFNVTPPLMGPYFAKIECFCFTEQTLAPGESVDMGVSFFIDPAIMDDPDLAGVKEITLSYSFYRVPPDAGGDMKVASHGEGLNEQEGTLDHGR